MRTPIVPSKQYDIKANVTHFLLGGFLHYEHFPNETGKVMLYRSRGKWKFEEVSKEDHTYKIINQSPGEFYGAGLSLDTPLNPMVPTTDITLRLSMENHLVWRFDPHEHDLEYKIVNVSPGKGKDLYLSIIKDPNDGGNKRAVLRHENHAYRWKFIPPREEVPLPQKIEAIIGTMQIYKGHYFMCVEKGESTLSMKSLVSRQSQYSIDFKIQYLDSRAYGIWANNGQHMLFLNANNILTIDHKNLLRHFVYKNRRPQLSPKTDWTLWNIIPEGDGYLIKLKSGSDTDFIGYDVKKQMFVLCRKENAYRFQIGHAEPGQSEPPAEKIKTIPIPGRAGQYIVDPEDIPSQTWAKTYETYGDGFHVEIADFNDWQLAKKVDEEEIDAEEIAASFKNAGNKLPKGQYWLQSGYIDGWSRGAANYPYWPLLTIDGNGNASFNNLEDFQSIKCKVILWRKEHNG